MKRITTAIFLLTALIANSVQAQTSSELSNNMPNATATGYMYDFEGVALENCPANAPYDQWFMPPAYTINSMGGDTLSVSTNGNQEGWHRLNLKLWDGECVDDTINLANNQNFEMTVHSSVSVPQCLITFFDDAGNPADGNPLVASLTPGLNTISVSDIDFSVWGGGFIDSTKIVVVGISFRIAWDDNAGGASPSVIGTFKIGHILMGDQTGLTLDPNPTSLEEDAINASLNVYPNPAQDHVNVSFEGASEGTVTLVDITGKTLDTQNFSSGIANVTFQTAELAQGVYLINILTRNAVITRRVVVK